ncbi:MAG TPA: type II toxin-antitoxin system PemK/MazF family toxin [Bacteroidales bacterium]|nr:type II toxin-antitoxin system PemK/MazF family toxin [Bacteroidales bacterium]
MEYFNFGEIVLLKFPYTDNSKAKKRPALIINDFGDGDIIVCRITSHIYHTKNDIQIQNWAESGLKLPSVIRIHKIATLDKSIVEHVMGKIDSSIEKQVKQLLSKLTD